MSEKRNDNNEGLEPQSQAEIEAEVRVETPSLVNPTLIKEEQQATDQKEDLIESLTQVGRLGTKRENGAKLETLTTFERFIQPNYFSSLMFGLSRSCFLSALRRFAGLPSKFAPAHLAYALPTHRR